VRALVTGAAGFIGSNLTDQLLQAGHDVTGFDNFSTGRTEFLARALACPQFRLVRADTLDLEILAGAMEGSDIVFHLAANADVRFGPNHSDRDLQQNTVATWNALEAMRRTGVKRIAFSSTGSVYGEPSIFPTPEDAPFPVQTSLYGASKLAGEALISAYCEGFGIEAWIFRFVSILGERYNHGHVFDFYKQLREDPGRLHVLGNGRQRKSYLYVGDCITAMLTAIEKAQRNVNILNLGTDDYCEVNDSIRWISEHLGLSPEITFGGGERGWVGDSPFIFLDCSRMRSLGWSPSLTIREGIVRTLEFLAANPWALSRP
jgi:UDP-glucose 4-epimerase